MKDSKGKMSLLLVGSFLVNVLKSCLLVVIVFSVVNMLLRMGGYLLVFVSIFIIELLKMLLSFLEGYNS